MAAAATVRAVSLPPTLGRIPALDGVRGIASLMVVYLHYIVLTVPAETGSRLALFRDLGIFGSTGVDLFFVLSGFLLAGILLDSRESPHYFRTFYVRRACRTFPLYWCVLASFLVFPLLGLGGRTLVEGPIPTWSYAVFVQNYYMGILANPGAVWLGATWSLAVEEQFYAVLPLTIRCLNRRNLAVLAISILVATPILRLALFYWDLAGALAVGFWSICRADALAAGVLAAILFRTPSVRVKMISLRRWMPAIVLTLLIITVCVYMLVRGSTIAVYGLR